MWEELGQGLASHPGPKLCHSLLPSSRLESPPFICEKGGCEKQKRQAVLPKKLGSICLIRHTYPIADLQSASPVCDWRCRPAITVVLPGPQQGRHWFYWFPLHCCSLSNPWGLGHHAKQDGCNAGWSGKGLPPLCKTIGRNLLEFWFWTPGLVRQESQLRLLLLPRQETGLYVYSQLQQLIFCTGNKKQNVTRT